MVTTKHPDCNTCYIMIIDGDEAPDAINLVPTLARSVWTHGVQVGNARDYKSHPYTRWMGSAMILPSFTHDTTGVGVRFIIPRAHHLYVTGTYDDGWYAMLVGWIGGETLGIGRIHADEAPDAINLVPTPFERIWCIQERLYNIVEELYGGGGIYATHI